MIPESSFDLFKFQFLINLFEKKYNEFDEQNLIYLLKDYYNSNEYIKNNFDNIFNKFK